MSLPDDTLEPPPDLRFYGRRKGRPLTALRQKLFEELLPHYMLALPDVPSFAAHKADLVFEIGFGGGEHLYDLATQNAEAHFIGAEAFLGGIAAMLARLNAKPLPNLKLYPEDARALLDALPAQSLAALYLLFPDPWPKSRHADRRFLGPSNLPRMLRALKKGGKIFTATDDPSLQHWTHAQLMGCDGLQPIENADFTITRPSVAPTRYEAKALKAGRHPIWYGAVRR